MVQHRWLALLASLAFTALMAVQELHEWLTKRIPEEEEPAWRAHYVFAELQADKFMGESAVEGSMPAVKVPPGSPIGG